MTRPATNRTRSFVRYLVIPAAILAIAFWLFYSPPGLLGKADGIGYAVCHRIDERSFHIGDRQLPLCARCSGMYLGAMVGLIYQTITARRKQAFPPWSVAVPLILFVVAFGVDGVNSYLYLLKSVVPGRLADIPNLYVPNNMFRLLTGSGMGLGLAAILFPAFNQTLWVQAEEKPAISWKGLLLLIGLTVLLDFLVLTESPVFLYPLAFLSAAGVVILLTMVYAIVWIMLTGQDNTFSRLHQAWLPLLSGLTVAFIQIMAVDLLRLWLTGTWGAFPLG